MKFRNFEELVTIVKGKSNRIVIPGANNEEAMEACKMACDNGLVSGGILIGPINDVKAMAARVGLKLDIFELVDCNDVEQMCNLAVKFIKDCKGDFLVKGLVDTKYYLKAILNKEMGMVVPGTVLSHFVLFETAHYHKLFALTDAAIMIKPNL